MSAPSSPQSPPEPTAPRARLHPDVLKLGFVSFLTDVSSEMIFSVFAVFFTTVAGASSALLGLIEGSQIFRPPRSTTSRAGCRTAAGSASGLQRRAMPFPRLRR